MMEPKDEEALRAIGQVLSQYRRAFLDSLRAGIESDVQKVEAEGFDPARGRGRGPRWAEAA